MKNGIIAGWITVLAMLSPIVFQSPPGKRNLAEDWVMPLAGLIGFVMIPLIWVHYLRRENRKRLGIIEKASLGLFLPGWILSAFVALWIMGWIATGGI